MTFATWSVDTPQQPFWKSHKHHAPGSKHQKKCPAQDTRVLSALSSRRHALQRSHTFTQFSQRGSTWRCMYASEHPTNGLMLEAHEPHPYTPQPQSGFLLASLVGLSPAPIRLIHSMTNLVKAWTPTHFLWFAGQGVYAQGDAVPKAARRT